MAVQQITKNLGQVITSIDTWSEVEITYLFVQIRKLLDHSNVTASQYKHLRFYCDWIVHISKDKIDDSTLEVLKDFELGMKEMVGKENYHANGPINFAYFESLQAELIEFLGAQDIEFRPFFENRSWVKVISLIVGVLTNQPLNIKASHGILIKSIEFQLSNPGTVWIRAIFNKPFPGADGRSYAYFDLKNAY